MTGRDQLRLDLEDLPAGTLPALTLWQPWATAIFAFGKDVENRAWPTRYRGRLVIHAGRRWDPAAAALVAGSPDDYPHRGVLLGTVRVVACTTGHRSRWAAAGQWHWVLADPRPLLVPVPASGRRGLWPVTWPPVPPRR